VIIDADGMDADLCTAARERSSRGTSTWLLPDSVYCAWLERDASRYRAGVGGRWPLLHRGAVTLSTEEQRHWLDDLAAGWSP
jgi:hypothetical protein